jgi:hypothetical protein
MLLRAVGRLMFSLDEHRRIRPPKPSEMGSSTTASVDVADIRRADWIDKCLCDDPQGHAVNASQAFRTVSPRDSMRDPRHRRSCGQMALFSCLQSVKH